MDLRPISASGQQLSGRSGRTITRPRTARSYYQVVRYEPKDFRQRRPNGKGGWDWGGAKKGEEVPYRLPELLAARKEAGVLIAAGEKDVDNLLNLELTATCNHGGEGKWWPALTPYFKDRRVFILCDNDETGERHQQVVGAALNAVAAEVRIVRFPELPPKGDSCRLHQAPAR